MIVFDLSCADGHRFEGWFASSADYEDQRGRGLLACPSCGSAAVSKAPMAPAVPAKGNSRQEVLPPDRAARPVANTSMPAEMQKALDALAKAQAAALKNSTWVGDTFAEESRKMHYGERDEAPIHGQATIAQAKALIEEGVPLAPLPFPVAPPEKLN